MAKIKEKPNKRLTIDRLFQATGAVTVSGNVIHFRVLSEADDQDINHEAMIAYQEKRVELENPESKEGRALRLYLEGSPSDQLIGVLCARYRSDWNREAIFEHPPKFGADLDPSSSSQEDRAKAIADREAEFDAAIERQKEFVIAREAEFKADAANWDRDVLVAECQEAMVLVRCRMQLDRVTEDLALFYACYADAELTDRYFKNVSEVIRMHPKIRDRILEEYRELAAIDPFD